ncbi:MAG: pyridoxal-phosphate dependent enzyme, partial [Acidobacteriota bacterium]
TMGLELAAQLDWTLPDVIVYPTGGGTGLIGMWKAFAELEALGWLKDSKRPRMVAVQSDGCCPIVRAFDAGERFATPFSDPSTIAGGLRVPAAVGDFMILDAIRESGGTAIAVGEQRLEGWMRLAAATEGIAVGPEAAACVGAAELLKREGWIEPDEKVVLFNCGGALKAPHLLAGSDDLPRLHPGDDVDWDALSGDTR